MSDRLSMLTNELRWAVRHLLHRPAFLVLGVLALGLGLAASVLVFMAVNTLSLRPVAGLATPDRLVEIGRLDRGGGFDSFSWPDFANVRDDTASLDKVFAYRLAPAYATVSGAPVRALSLLVSGDYFATLGTGAAHGRLIAPLDDAVPGDGAVVVASHAAFQRLFGGDPAAIGSELAINGTRYTLVGVAAPGFHGHIAALSPDFFVPLSMAGPMHAGGAERDSRGARSLMLGGRLAEGASLAEANAELDALSTRLAEAFPDSNRETRFAAAPLRPLPQAAQRIIGMLAGALFVLCAAIVALACTNLAGVLLAQGEARAGELAMRSVLGASRARLARQLFLEAVLVAAGGGLLALLLVYCGRGLLQLLPLPAPYPLDLSLQLDWRVLVFCLAATGVVALGFGLLPALRVSAVAPGREAGASASGSRARQRLRHGLLAVQATMTVALLLTGALVLRALHAADAIDTGFPAEGVYTADLDLTPMGMEPGAATAALAQLTDRLEREPGIEVASFASVVPLTLSRLGFGHARTPGADEHLGADVNTVGEGFFQVFDIPVRGRALDRTDTDGATRTAVINHTLAKRLFGEADPLGSEFELGSRDAWQRIRVVGVVPDGRYASMGDAGTPFAFLSAAQWQRTEFALVLRTRPEGGPGAEALRQLLERELRQLLPGVPPPPVHPFAASAALSMLPQTILAVASGVLGVLALVLAATGLYGVLAFQLQRRVREIGVRKALGAPSARVLRGVLGRSLAWLAIGGGVGLLLGQVLALALGDLLFGIRGYDLAALAGVAVAFLLMVAVASALPLRRALLLQPSEALRHD